MIHSPPPMKAAIARDHTSRKQRRRPSTDQCAVAAACRTRSPARGQEAKALPHRHGFQILLDTPAAARLQEILCGELAGL
jgi:hypothetical protein